MSVRKDPYGPKGRTEPTLGDLDRLDEPSRTAPRDDLPQVNVEPGRRRAAPLPPPPASAPRERRRGWFIPLLLLVLVGVVTVLWLNQDRLRGLVPRTELNDVLTRADTALKNGRLDGSDGSSARELFSAARALEPDNDRALDGLRAVGQAELSQADAQRQAGKLDDAARSAASARDLLGGGTDVDQIDHAIAAARAAQVNLGDLVDQASQALGGGRLDGDAGAAALYLRVLTADPGNAVATHGLDQVGAAYTAQARKALDANDLATASASIDKLATLLPHYGDLPALRQALAQGQQQRSDALNDANKKGQNALLDGHIAGAGNDTALAYFKAALAIDPDNPDAKTGLGKVAQALTTQANAMLDSGDAAQAGALLDQAQALAPKSADLADARARLADVTKAAGAPAGNSAPAAAASAAGAGAAIPPAMLSPEQTAKVAQLVQQAKDAGAHGNIMLPPGQSAYDLYRSALAIDGNNAAARSGLQALPALVVHRFNDALGQGDLNTAGDMLANLADLSPGAAGQDTLRQRLATAWLDRAEQQLDRNDRAGASQSLDQVRKLAPQQPRLQELSARLGH
jgi:tetratricopeptide (TPR) repeat protein